jgi:hypothetical protein
MLKVWDKPKQEYTSKDTSNDKYLPITYKYLTRGINADLGGGKYDTFTKVLKSKELQILFSILITEVMKKIKELSRSYQTVNPIQSQ